MLGYGLALPLSMVMSVAAALKLLLSLGYVVLGGSGTGKTHLATAMGISGLTRHGKRVRFYSTVDLVNALEQEKA